jgi:hypothetical protein
MERTDIDQVVESHGLALEWLGAGAKTASGYGQMVSNDKHSLVIAGKSLEEQVRLEVDSWSDHKIAENIGKNYNKIKKREAENWLKQTAKELCTQHNTPEKSVLLGKLLAKKWDEIDDASLKTDVLGLIKPFWEKNGGWEGPHSGGSRKKAFEIYGKGLDITI